MSHALLLPNVPLVVPATGSKHFDAISMGTAVARYVASTSQRAWQATLPDTWEWGKMLVVGRPVLGLKRPSPIMSEGGPSAQSSFEEFVRRSRAVPGYLIP